MTIPRRSILGMIGASVLLTACSSTLAPLTYDLNAPRLTPTPRRSRRTIVITLPKAVATYDTERVVVREAGGVLSYLPEAQWSDRLPKLLQTRLLQAFEFSGFPNIGRPDDQLAVDMTLATEIVAFEIDAARGGVASVSLGTKLVDERNGSIPASTLLSATMPGSLEDGRTAVAGLDAALASVSQQMLQWVASKA